MHQVLIADDHPLFRQALRQALGQCLDPVEIHEADTLEATHVHLDAHPETDLVLLDIHMPGSRGLNGLVSLRCRYPAVAVVVVSASEDADIIRRALDHGAQGFVPKSAGLEMLREAITAVIACEIWVPSSLKGALDGAGDDAPLAARLASLTPQQYRVLEFVADGLLNKQIAAELGIRERTVKAHMSDIFHKLGVRNRTQAGVLFKHLDIRAP